MSVLAAAPFLTTSWSISVVRADNPNRAVGCGATIRPVSHFILICERGPRAAGADVARSLEECARLLWPPGVPPRATTVIAEDSLSLAVVRPNDGVLLHGASLCLGRILDTPGKWWRPDTAAPDGTYALCRCSADAVEIVTDIAASRAVWYYHDDAVFLASSSQRPLVALLGSLQLDAEAVTWMVAARSLGPRSSYDQRLHKAPLDGRVRLNRHTWSVDVYSQWEPYEPDDLSDDEHVRRLNDALVETCAYLAPEADRWPLLLSGGYDSRALLVAMLQTNVKPRCVTWGFEASLDDRESDAFVARQLARTVGVPHHFFGLDSGIGTAADVLDQFIVSSEGQVTDFTMYVDGFETWRTLVGQDCVGVVRGDNYPWAYLGEFRTPRTVRHHCGADFLSDYAPNHLIQRLGLARQTWPSQLEQRAEEDLLRYRDRLQRTFYIPARVAPLNQIKSSYLEIVNPLKARRIAEVVKRLPERLRLHPGALAKVLALKGPAVPFATRPAATLPPILERPAMREAIATGLCSDTSYRLFDGAAIDEVARALLYPPAPASRADAKRKLRAALPRRLKDFALPVVGVRLDTRELALRMLIAARAVEMLENDAGRIGPTPWAIRGGAAASAMLQKRPCDS